LKLLRIKTGSGIWKDKRLVKDRSTQGTCNVFANSKVSLKSHQTLSTAMVSKRNSLFVVNFQRWAGEWLLSHRAFPCSLLYWTFSWLRLLSSWLNKSATTLTRRCIVRSVITFFLQLSSILPSWFKWRMHILGS